MSQMINLLDLLKHQIADLYSAEDQIIEALPSMIEKATNPDLAAALRDHLKVTKEQKSRLEQAQNVMNEIDHAEITLGENKGGFFSRLFGGSAEKCKAMEGLITEANNLMGEDMSEEVMDAAIIGAAQKIEHYEIAGYGTARAYAAELKMTIVAGLLSETLREEYMADDLLTRIAVGNVNLEAEVGEEKMAEQNNGITSKKNQSMKKSTSKVAQPGNKGLRSAKGKDSKGAIKSNSKTSFVKKDRGSNNLKSSSKSAMPSKGPVGKPGAKSQITPDKNGNRANARPASGKGKESRSSSKQLQPSRAKSGNGRNAKPVVNKTARPIVAKGVSKSDKNTGKNTVKNTVKNTINKNSKRRKR